MIPYHWSLMKKLIWLKKAILSGAIWKTVTGSLIHIVDALASPVNALSVRIDPVQSGSGDPSPDNVRPISGWTGVNVWIRPTHDTSANPAVSITFPTPPGTVYGGTLDVLSGVLTVTHKKVEFFSYASWGRTTNGATARLSAFGLDDMKNIPEGETERTIKRTALCKMNALKPSTVGWSGTAGSTEPQFVTSYDGYLMLNIGVPSPTKEQTNQFISDTGLYIVYPLATPQTIQLTASEVSTLLGENNIWASTGDTTVTYMAQA